MEPNTDKPQTLDEFITQERPNMATYLRKLQSKLRPDLRISPECYKENPDDEPTIDIRLCIDKPVGLSDRVHPPKNWTWCFNIGSSDYDQYHSDYCAASCIDLETEADDLLEELLNQIGNAE